MTVVVKRMRERQLARRFYLQKSDCEDVSLENIEGRTWNGAGVWPDHMAAQMYII
jgi:hypothetical protein